MKKFKRSWIATGAGVAALAALIAALFWIFKPNGDLAAFIQHPATTAWAQSLGSFGAVAVALWLAYDEGRRHRAAERKARLDHLAKVFSGVLSSANFLTGSLRLADELSETQAWYRGAARAIIADIDIALGALVAAPAAGLPSRVAADAVLQIIRAGNAARVDLTIVDQIVDHGGPISSSMFRGHLLEVMDGRIKLQSVVSDALLEVGS